MPRAVILSVLIPLLLVNLAPAGGPAESAVAWQKSVIDGAKYGSYCSHVTLPSGHPAVSHFETATGNLLYSWFDGAAWRTTVVDSSMGDARSSSLALLPDGNPAIAYFDLVKWNLKYAWFDGTRWRRMVVDDDEWTGDHCSLAILPSGYPAISYRGLGLRYAAYDGREWHITIVDPYVDAGWCTSLKILPSGQPAISYYWDYYWGNKDLSYAWFDGAQWHIDIVETSTYAMCLSTSLAIQSNGQPAIAWSTLQDGVRFAWYQEADKKWHFSDVFAGGRYASLAIEPDGTPAVSFLDPLGDQLLYARPASKGWDTTFIDTVVEDDGLGGGRASSLLMGPGGQPRVAYLDIQTNTLKYAYATNDGVWHPTIAVPGQLEVGKYASMAVLHDGQLAVAYLDETKQQLKYAWRTGRTWQTMLVDERGAAGISLAVLPEGQPAISYYDGCTGDVKYAEFHDDGWSIAVIEPEAVPPDETDVFTSLAVLPNGAPAISYHVTYPLYDQKYAWFDGFQWRTTTVDKGLVWRCSSLMILPNGQPAITYRCWENGQNVLTYACFDGTAWRRTGIDAVTDGSWSGVGRDNSLALQPTGLPAVAYYDQINYDLKYAWLDGDGWHVIRVDADGDVGDHCALAFLPNGDPVISYYLKGDAGDLRYAWWDLHSPTHVARWQCATVASAQNVGAYSSIVVNRSGQPAIAYYNWSSAALMLAERLTPVPVAPVPEP